MSWRVVEVLQRRQEQSVQPWENFLKIIVMLVRWGGAKSQKLILAGGAMQFRMPRSFELLLEDQFLPVFSGYLKNWLWEMQVPYSLF